MKLFGNLFQYVYSSLYDKKKLEQSAKNPQNYAIESNESFVFEQNPIEIDIFNAEEKKEIKERVEGRKKKRQEVAEKNKVPKRQKKVEKEKEDEQELWARLRTLNKEFKNINKSKKKAKDMSNCK